MNLSMLLSELFDDLRAPGFLWQAGAIVLCVAAGWGLARLIRATFLQRAGRGGSVRDIGVESFARALSPLLMLGLLVLAKALVARYQPVNLLRLAVPLFASFAVIRVVFYLFRRVFARRGPVSANMLVFERIFGLLVWLGVALYITGLWPDLLEVLDTTLLPLGRHKVSLTSILQAAASVVVLLMLALWAGAALEERLMGVRGLHSSLRVVLARMSRTLLIAIAVLLSMNMVGIDLTVLSVFGGALGVGLGLGLQRIASNYVSGVVILLERRLSIGDMISVDKYAGKISQINTRYTVLQGLDGAETVLPNEMLISGPVQNQSRSSRLVRVSTLLTVAYDSDLDSLMPMLAALPVGVPLVLETPAPAVSLNKFGPDGIELELGCWIVDPDSGRGVVSDVNKKIHALIQSGDIKLSLPALDPHRLDARIAAAVAGISHAATN